MIMCLLAYFLTLLYMLTCLNLLSLLNLLYILIRYLAYLLTALLVFLLTYSIAYLILACLACLLAYFISCLLAFLSAYLGKSSKPTMLKLGKNSQPQLTYPPPPVEIGKFVNLGTLYLILTPPPLFPNLGKGNSLVFVS